MAILSTWHTATGKTQTSQNVGVRLVHLLVVAGLLAGCSGSADSTTAPSTTTTTTTTILTNGGPTARILLVGDVMTGRGLSDLLSNKPEEVFAGVRHLVTAADVAGLNLESPLTTRPHISPNDNQLQADPATAGVLAAAGFDVLSLPNNHTMDSGPEGLLDTIAAARDAGMLTVGAGADEAAEFSPLVITAGGIDIGFLAYDTTGVGEAAGAGPGVARWDEDRSIADVTSLNDQVDVVVISVHGGTEYLPVTDPGMAEIATVLTDAGADIVWGHGAHVIQPVIASGDAVISTSLGNFLFDQIGPDRTTGYALEVMVDGSGTVAYRVGVTEHGDRRVELVAWLEPEGDAVWMHNSWWELTRSPPTAETSTIDVGDFRFGEVTAAAEGDINGDGATDTVVSFRRPHRSTPLMESHPEVQWADASGRSAHLGVYEPETLTEIWVAGTVRLPVAQLEVCDAALALVHNSLDDPDPSAGSAWVWNGFGFDTAPDIPGGGIPACSDINGDGATDPIILNRG